MSKLIAIAEEKETTCKACKSLLSYNYGDITHSPSETSTDFWYIKCPACKEKHYVPEWKSAAKTKQNHCNECAKAKDDKEILLLQLTTVQKELNEALKQINSLQERLYYKLQV